MEMEATNVYCNYIPNAMSYTILGISCDKTMYYTNLNLFLTLSHGHKDD